MLFYFDSWPIQFRRPAALEEQVREFNERAKALEEGNRKLAAPLLEAQENTKKGK